MTDDIDALTLDITVCTACPLHAGRTYTVPGDGPMPAPLLLLGEGPGADEDRTGHPFVGRAGQLLTKMLAAIGIDRTRVYITNVVKCRPPENRTPTEDEALACAPFLARQIALVDPTILVPLGLPATQMLLGSRVTALQPVRGQWHALGDRLVFPLFHPAYLLRQPSAKATAWADLQQLAERLHAVDLYTAVALAPEPRLF